jgi:hypothetical protein
MSSIYGDSIFESTDMIIDRLFESINNDMLMFKDFNIIKEDNNDTFWADFKKFISTVIIKIKELIAKIVQKVKNIKRGIKVDIVLKDVERALSKDTKIDSIYILDTDKINKFTKDIMSLYRGIESTDLNQVIANNDQSYIDGINKKEEDINSFINEIMDKYTKKIEKDTTRTDILFTYFSRKEKIKFSSGNTYVSFIRSNIDNCFRAIDSYCDIITKSQKNINKMEKLLNSFGHKINSTHNIDVDVQFAANVIRATISGLKSVINYSNMAIKLLDYISHCRHYSLADEEFTE